MSNKEELLKYIRNLSEEQVEKVMERVALLRQVMAMTDAEATYTEVLTGKLFGFQPHAQAMKAGQGAEDGD